MNTVHIMKHRKARKRKMTTKWYKTICRKYKNSKQKTICRFCNGERDMGWNFIFCFHEDSATCGCYCRCGK